MIEYLKNQWQPEVRGYNSGLLCLSATPSTGRLEIDRSTRKLATAILVQALRDAMVVGVRLREEDQKRWRNDALDWFFSPNSQPGSFNWVIQVIQADAESFRKWIRTYMHGDGKLRRQMEARLKKTRLLHR